MCSLNLGTDFSTNDDENQNYQVHDLLTNRSLWATPRGEEHCDGDELEAQSNVNILLEENIRTLRRVIRNLKSELTQERTLWKRELDEFSELVRRQELEENHRPTTPRRESYTVHTPDFVPNQVGSDSLIIKEYEERLQMYQEAFMRAQMEKRENMRRQIYANTYRQRLTEVEKKCEEELEKVRHSTTILEPLKQMASEWGRQRLKSPDYSNKQINILKHPVETISSEEGFGDTFKNDTRHIKKKSVNHVSGDTSVEVRHIDTAKIVDDDMPDIDIGNKIIVNISNPGKDKLPPIRYTANFD